VDCVSSRLCLPVHPQAGSATLDENAQHYKQNDVLTQGHICSLSLPATVQIILSVETLALNPWQGAFLAPWIRWTPIFAVYPIMLSTPANGLPYCTLLPGQKALWTKLLGQRSFQQVQEISVSSSSQLFTRTDFDASTFRAHNSASPLHQQRDCAACAAAGTRRAQAAAPRCRRRPRRLRRLHAASCPRLPLPSPRCRAAAGPQPEALQVEPPNFIMSTSGALPACM